jgi:4-hydroxy-tetrahydrodipicolinate reductase
MTISSQRSLVIVGHGKMGRAIEQLARAGGWNVLATLDKGWHEDSGAREALAKAGVAVEFSEPAQAVTNIRAIVDAGCPVVVGTTGWYEHLDEVTGFVRAAGGALLWSPNYSMGAQILISLARTAGLLIKQAGIFDSHLLETHHVEKKDIPSGTAISIASTLESTLGRHVPITSVRSGHEPGTHELIFDASFEQIRLSHHARDRRVFAAGALLAADWLRMRGAGVFTMQDVLQSAVGGRES